jgi:hypothetical protein
VVQPGVPPLVLQGAASANSSFMAPPPGKLPGTLRVSVESRDADRLSSSIVSMVPSYDAVAQAYAAASGTFLALPMVSLGAAGAVSWGVVPAAQGYRVSVRPADQVAPTWEAWTIAGTSATIPAASLPPAGTGEVKVEAVDAAGLTSRSVAGVRQLRVAPWTQRDLYRVAYRRLPI